MLGLTAQYLDQLKALPRGDRARGEIELMCTPEEIAAATEETTRRLVERGQDPALARVGVVYEDQYLRVFRDAVRFRSGAAGTYLRVTLPGGLDGDGGVVLVVMRGGRVLLKRSFRHATRRWEIEFPRGFRSAGASVEQAALAELHEETGRTALGPPRLIGRILPDSGLMPHTVSVVGVRVQGQPGEMQLEEMESINPDELWMSPSEMNAATRDGTLRDGLTLAAWALSLASGWSTTPHAGEPPPSP